MAEWWTIPVVELNAFSDQLPVLIAQEALALSNVYGVGSGNMKRTDRDRILRDWRLDSGMASAFRKAAKRQAQSGSLPFRGIGGA